MPAWKPTLSDRRFIATGLTFSPLREKPTGAHGLPSPAVLVARSQRTDRQSSRHEESRSSPRDCEIDISLDRMTSRSDDEFCVNSWKTYNEFQQMRHDVKRPNSTKTTPRTMPCGTI